ncbi:hypothetical protein NM208_g921 [Fusarium decemcellulare]|uniref:Uncharacterized protein n=1 Tax=Fusarium decemcellulare TaxID=57161 RepID=A0ACC1SY37_9HYPO|nr:hypothetical protein NM208_g921 [Fusarium decemcellulare]
MAQSESSLYLRESQASRPARKFFHGRACRSRLTCLCGSSRFVSLICASGAKNVRQGIRLNSVLFEMSQAASLSKSCAPCRQRKIKCDAAITGVPCGSCIRKASQDRCVLPTRKRRETHLLQKARALRSQAQLPPTNGGLLKIKDPESDESPETALVPYSTATPSRYQTTRTFLPHLDECTERQTGVHYCNILSDLGGKKDCRDNFDHRIKPSTSCWSGSNKPHHHDRLPLDPVDEAFLTGKGAFELPPYHCIEVILQAWFEYVYPYAPVVNRADFLQSFRSGNYSYFLMHSILAVGSHYTPLSVIQECGFNTRLEAQECFASKAKLLHDFQHEPSLVRNIQGSIILGAVACNQRHDKDYRYWFYNAARLLAAAESPIIGKDCVEEWVEKWSGLYKRMWWTLYCRDVLLTFMGVGGIGVLIHRDCDIRPLAEGDWEDEDASSVTDKLLLPLSSRKKRAFILYCKLSLIGSRCLSAVTSNPQRDYTTVIEPLEAWRSLLHEVLQIDNQGVQHDMPYSFLMASSYRFECILLRSLRPWWEQQDVTRSDWAKRRLRSAMFELDSIIGRMLTNDMLSSIPLSLATSIPILLVLHIESILDASDSEANKSISRVFIGQDMLILRRLSELPTINQVLPTFERVLTRYNIAPLPYEKEPLKSPQLQAEVDKGTDEDNGAWSAGSDISLWQEVPNFNDFSFGDFFTLDFLDN